MLSLDSKVEIPVRSRRRGAQPVRASASSTSRCCRAAATVAAAEGRRRDPAGPHHGPAGHQRAARPTPTAACRRSRSDNLKTAVDEAYTAVGGLGPELSRLVKGSTAVGHRRPQEPRPADHADRPVRAGAGLARPTPSDSIQAWAAQPGDDHRPAASAGHRPWQGSCRSGPGAADEVRALFDRLQPTLPIVLANLVSIGEVAVTYQPTLEQLLVLLPQGTAVTAGRSASHKRNTKQDYKGDYLNFNLNLNLPPPCTTGFLPSPAAAAADLPGLPGPAGRRRVLPGPAGLAVQRARRAQPAVRDRPGQTRADGEDVRKRRELRATQRRLQLEGRPERDPVGPSHPAAAAGLATCASTSAAAVRRRRR